MTSNVHIKQKTHQIYYTKQHFIKTIKGQIQSRLSKAFWQNKQRNLWEILYGKGHPLGLIGKIIIGRRGNSLYGKHNGDLWKSRQ